MKLTVIPVWKNIPIDGQEEGRPYAYMTRDFYGMLHTLTSEIPDGLLDRDIKQKALELLTKYGFKPRKDHLHKVVPGTYWYDCMNREAYQVLCDVNPEDAGGAAFNHLRLHMDLPIGSFYYETTRWFWAPLVGLAGWAQSQGCFHGSDPELITFITARDYMARPNTMPQKKMIILLRQIKEEGKKEKKVQMIYYHFGPPPPGMNQEGN